ncbi:GNAT family N-acetyltransferase [Oceanirhabdus sp. W0125-5]|uniref:GNAT family N-acetyltransferase n=1 Tax=Oceanirhabdus sp. W0125-5 TaxID=2999116 RepID=UPI0022F32D0C|nr:GNAT family N-acetyltransferase [Oceanirhabdus sp. W0125-5]WBW95584.1 GNAT family N-acetyltransferase [Oceanirhabdus sp. W0125-5]
MKKLIPETLETKRLIITNSKIEECDELQKICESWDDKKLIEGSNIEPDYIYKCITEGDLPPVTNASRENYKLKSIYLKDNGKLIGFTDLYFGYPKEKTIWISLFLISKDFRKKGYAQEVIECISKEGRTAEYEKIGIGVHLKNWRGLRFWTKSGFDRVVGIFGDEDYSENTYAVIGLEKNL